MNFTEAKEYIRERIKKEGFYYTNDKVWLSPRGEQATWTFDMKALLLDKDFLQAACEVFWHFYDRTKPIQICGLEAASIPLITALVLSGKDANGLYIRKSKKKKYDLREMEGVLRNAPIVLVDDVLSTGNSTEKQITVLKKYHCDVSGIFTFVHTRELSSYSYLQLSHGLRTNFLFDSSEFVERKTNTINAQLKLEEEWRFVASLGNEFNVVRRNQMFVSDQTIYLNADDGFVYAMSQKTGEIYWQTKIQKAVSPATNQGGIIKIDEGIYAASENGVLWAISDRNGEELFKYSIGDHLYGDIKPLNDHRLILTGKDGQTFYTYIFDIKEKRVVWSERNPFLVFAAVGDKTEAMILAHNNGQIQAFDKKTLKKLWEIKVIGSISDRVSFSLNGKRIAVVTSEGIVYLLRTSDGVIVKETKIDEPFLSAAPLFHNGKLYFTAAHRTVYCLNAETLEKIWEFNTKGRIFGGVAIVGNKVFFGNNEGILYALDAKTGQWLGSYMHGDRIVSEPVVIGEDRVIFQTISNQVVSLKYQPADPVPTSLSN